MLHSVPTSALRRRALAVAISVSLAACGGGGGTTSDSSGASGALNTSGSSASGSPASATTQTAPQTTGSGSAETVFASTGGQPPAPESATAPPALPEPTSVPTEVTATPAAPATPTAPATVAAADARFNSPYDIASDQSGNLYVADAGNFTVRKITPAGQVSVLAGTPGVKGNVDGAAASARFSSLSGITVDGSGNVYVIDRNAIRKIGTDGTVSTLAGSLDEVGYADRTGTAALFYSPQGIAADATGNVYVADFGNSAVRKISPAGVVTTFLRDVSAYYRLQSIAIRGNDMYIGGENQVWHVLIGTQGGASTILVGGADKVYGSVDGNATTSRFWPVQGMTIDSAGNAYAVEAFQFGKANFYHGAIRKLTPDPANVGYVITSTLGGSNTVGTADGPIASAGFNFPTGITTDAAGNLYVADYQNHAIRKITPAGIVSTFAGKVGEAGSN